MNEMNQVQDDEIDLFELFQTLWDGKWLISAFVATAVLLGGSFLLSKGAVFESKIIYSTHAIPHYYNKNKVSTDFQNKFYSGSVFEKWKQNNSNTPIVFEDFSKTEVVDGFVMSRNEDGLLAILASEKKDGSFVIVRSNQLPILDGFFKYAIHINGLLKGEYVARAKEDLKAIDLRFKGLRALDGKIIDTVLLSDRFIVSAENGANVLTIQRPTIPKKVSPNTSLTLALSIVLGGMVGVFFILVRNAIIKRKEQLGT